jgi:hypothetical protein
MIVCIEITLNMFDCDILHNYMKWQTKAVTDTMVSHIDKLRKLVNEEFEPRCKIKYAISDHRFKLNIFLWGSSGGIT